MPVSLGQVAAVGGSIARLVSRAITIVSGFWDREATAVTSTTVCPQADKTTRPPRKAHADMPARVVVTYADAALSTCMIERDDT